jgi:hypothetical protein
MFLVMGSAPHAIGTSYLKEKVPFSCHVSIKHHDDFCKRNVLELARILLVHHILQAVVHIGTLAIDLPGATNTTRHIPAGKEENMVINKSSQAGAVFPSCLRHTI